MAKVPLKIPAQIKKAHKAATKARKSAHAPYSKFLVGAAVVDGGQLTAGCNIENASYGGTVCAERVAMWTAVAQGQKKFSDIVIVTGANPPAAPCGFCRQVMAEFMSPKARVWLASPAKILKVYNFEDLLPEPFNPKSLRSK